MKKIPILDLQARYFRYLLPYSRQLVLALLTMIGVAVLDLAAPWPLKFIVDNIIGGRPFTGSAGQAIVDTLGEDARVLTAVLGLAIILVAILSGLFSFIYEYSQGLIKARTTFQLRG